MNHRDTLLDLANSLVLGVQDILHVAQTEEDFRIGFEKLLSPIKDSLNLKINPKYEKSIYSGRADAVHGQVIIEYEKPGSFRSERKIKHAYEQLVRYLYDEVRATGLTQLVGVGFDGEKIFFVKCKERKASDVKRERFYMLGPYDFDLESARTLLLYLRGLSRLPLSAENLIQKFGPDSPLAQRAIPAFANALEYWGDQTHIRTFFNEWKRLFGIVYGEKLSGSQEEAEALAKLYKVGEETDFQELLFSIHTYFAFLMKLIAAEILTLSETSFSSSLAYQMVHASDEDLKRQLEDIENGGIYARRGIINFLEGDFFRWYLYALDSPELREVIREIARGLSEFEPATSTLDPAYTRDLLKKLYQYLVPKKVRHRLGEYYTPDWLAELLLNEVGYKGNTLKRLLDPACGSGTFLVLAIQRAIKHGREKEKLPDFEIAKRILSNIWGFDLNPLAVIAARTNYLFALGDLVNEVLDRGGKVEIPVYLCDSVLTPARIKSSLIGEVLEVSTSVGKFHIPAHWIRGKGLLLSRAVPLIEEMVKSGYSVEEAVERLKKEGLVFANNKRIVEDFYKEILKLEQENKNGIWVRFLKNAFAPIMAGKFDFVVGNPPWVRWDYLSQEYRKATLHLWKEYGLFSLKGYAQMLGGAKPDFSMLFTYVSADHYLKNRAKIGFLITQEVFKAKGAGEGFRRFRIDNKEYLKVLKAHDFTMINPFEGASNKPAAIILQKGDKTIYPVPYFIWNKKSNAKIKSDMLLSEVLPLLYKKRYKAQPVGLKVETWQTFQEDQEDFEKISKIKGKNSYRARAGVSAEPYGIFLLKLNKVMSDGYLLMTNLIEKGRTKLPKIEFKIESDLVFPAISGADIKRWAVNQKFFVLLVNDRNNPMRGYPEEVLKKKWPLAFSYLLRFKNKLLRRASYKRFHAKANAPFYSQYNVGFYTFERYKVVWKRMSNDIYASVISQIKTPFGYKQIIPLNTTTFFPTNNESEAHYLCAIINSTPVREFIKSFSSPGRGFGTPSVMKYVGIPKFDPKNRIHQKLSELSKKCHILKSEGKDNKIKDCEKEIDRLVEELFGINSD